MGIGNFFPSHDFTDGFFMWTFKPVGRVTYRSGSG